MGSRILDELKAAVGNGSRLHDPDGEGALESVSDHAKHWSSEVEKFIAENPVVALSVAVTVGIILGWWVKRR